MKRKIVTSVLETSQYQLQEYEIKIRVFHLKNSSELYLTVATPHKIILILLYLMRHLKPYSFYIKHFSRKYIFYEIFNRCRTFGIHCIYCDIRSVRFRVVVVKENSFD